MATEIYLRKLHHSFVPIDAGQLGLMEDLAPNSEFKAVLTQPKNLARTIAQNSGQWPILSAFSKQVKWPINGQPQYISAEDWKDILTAAYRNETVRVAQGFEGGVVMLGLRTREFSEEEWPNWMAYLNWAAAEKGVKVSVSKRYARELGFSDE
jgi:hypothetical protein